MLPAGIPVTSLVALSMPDGSISAVLDEFQLDIGPGQLPVDSTVDVEIMEPISAENLPVMDNDTPYTRPLRLTPGEVSSTDTVLARVSVANTDRPGFGLYALQYHYNPDNSHQSAPTWQLLPGVLSDENGQFNIALPVNKGTVDVVFVESPLVAANASPTGKASPHRISSRSTGSDDFADMSFIVTCLKRAIKECEEDVSFLSSMGSAFAQAAFGLAGMGFDSVRLELVDEDFVKTEGYNYVLIGDNDDEYVHVSWVRSLGTDESGRSILGEYSRSTGRVSFIKLDGGLQRTAAFHELAHATQEWPFRTGWLHESTAEAVNTALGAARGLPERDWSFGLRTNLYAYQTYPLFQAVDGSLSYFPAFFDAMESASPDYEQVSEALEKTAGADLKKAYLDTIKGVNSKSDYEFCPEQTLSCTQEQHESGKCLLEHPKGALDALSAHCAQVKFELKGCDSKEYEIKFVGENKYLADGEVFKKGEKHTFAEKLKLWAVNDDFSSVTAVESEVRCADACPCAKEFAKIPMTVPPWDSSFSFAGINRVALDVNSSICNLINPIRAPSIFFAPYVYNSLVAASNSCGAIVRDSVDNLVLTPYSSKPEEDKKQFSACKKLVAKKTQELFNAGVPIAVGFEGSIFGDNAVGTAELNCETPTNL